MKSKNPIEERKCLICLEQPAEGRTRGDIHHVTCPRCGHYSITREAHVNYQSTHLTNRQIANISGWVASNPGTQITAKNLDHFLLSLPTPTFHERADSLLLAIERKTQFIGQYVTTDIAWLAITYSDGWEEIDEIATFLQESKRIHSTGNYEDDAFKILPGGWAHLEKLKKVNADQQQGFVAMWFAEEMKAVYDNAIAPGILQAGYKPYRTDTSEFNQRIDDEIMAQIRRSRFILADFTGHRENVYYETGFAQGLGLEVIWTCRGDDVENLTFDVRQQNYIAWHPDNMDGFARDIANRIEAIMGRGSYRNG